METTRASRLHHSRLDRAKLISVPRPRLSWKARKQPGLVSILVKGSHLPGEVRLGDHSAACCGSAGRIVAGHAPLNVSRRVEIGKEVIIGAIRIVNEAQIAIAVSSIDPPRRQIS